MTAYARSEGPQAVIVSAARTPIGRAAKGSLTTMRPDDLAAGVITAALAKLDGFDPSTLDDIYVGCAEPRDEQGGNLARRVAVQLGLDGVPAATINRFCASSVQTARMAFHAIKAGEGHAFVSAGVECVSRYRGFGSAGVDPIDTHNPIFATAEQRSLATAASNQRWHDPRDDGVLPDVYIAMGQTAENLATVRGISRADQDEFGVRSQNLAEKAIANQIFDAEIVPVTLPDGTVVRMDDGPRPGTTIEAVTALRPALPRGWHRHCRQLLPFERWGGCRGDHERSPCGRARTDPVGPYRGDRRQRSESGDHGAGTSRVKPPCLS